MIARTRAPSRLDTLWTQPTASRSPSSQRTFQWTPGRRSCQARSAGSTYTLRGASVIGSPSRQLDLDRAVDDAHGVRGDLEVGVDEARARREVEVVPVPRADDRLPLEPTLGEGPVLVRADGAHRVKAPAARVEHG